MEVGSVDLDAIFETVPIGLCLSDASWTILRVNGAFAEIVGASAAALIGKRLCSIFDRVDTEGAQVCGAAEDCQDCRLRQTIEDALASGSSQKGVEIRLHLSRPKADAETVILASSARIGLGDSRGFILYVQDVTESHRSDSLARTLSQAVEQSPVTTVITGLDGTIEYLNPMFSQTTGFSKEEAIGQNPRIISSGELPPSVYAGMWQTIKSGGTWKGLFHNKKKSGELYWEEAIISPVKDAEGRIVHYLALKQDITERKRLEERLRLQAAAMDSTLGFIVIADAQAPDLPIIYANAAFTKVTGYSQEEVIGKNPRFLHEKESRQPGLDEVRTGLRLGQACTALLKNFRKDGTPFWNEIYISPVRDESGKLTHFVGISNDVTAMVAIREELVENERRLRISQELANIGTWDWDIERGTLQGSERVDPLFGLRGGKAERYFDEFLGSIHPDDRPFVSRALADCVATGNSFRVEHRVVLADGSIRWLHENGNLIRDEEGTPRHLLGIVEDITDRKMAELDMLRSREEALKATKVKSEFLSSMSHELRTPMNAILGFGQLLERDGSLGESQLDFIREMMKAGRHLLDLINEVLDLSKIEAGKIELAPESVSCVDLIDEGINLIAPLAGKRNVRFELSLAGAPIVTADRMRLKQALVNLLSNSVKYNREGGLVKVSLSTLAGKARFEVEDSGLGIPADRIEELFTPFNRLGRDSSEIEGSGIGLLISKRLVELMGGSIGVESEEGRGSRFWIDMPLSTSGTSDREAEIGSEWPRDSQPPSPPPGTCPTVLYIEDNPANLRLVSRILATREDIYLLTAPGSSLGLELAEAHRPDLILLDLNMPDMDGYGVLARLRASDWGKSTPVVAVTALAMTHDIERGKAAGFAEYLTKPLDVQRFLDVVDSLLKTGPHER
ncbi:MAG TPA: PAS domain S-box protein [Rectinemataceae bacterium]|nr:PAS domain S-box protein [Rectinemataceae bacterium]